MDLFSDNQDTSEVDASQAPSWRPPLQSSSALLDVSIAAGNQACQSVLEFKRFVNDVGPARLAPTTGVFDLRKIRLSMTGSLRRQAMVAAKGETFDGRDIVIDGEKNKISDEAIDYLGICAEVERAASMAGVGWVHHNGMYLSRAGWVVNIDGVMSSVPLSVMSVSFSVALTRGTLIEWCESTGCVEEKEAHIRMMSWIDSVLQRDATCGHDLIKMIEPVFKTRYLELTGCTVDNFDQMTYISEKTKRKTTHLDLAEELLDMAATTHDPEIALALFGDMKLGGSPVIDLQQTMLRVRDLGTNRTRLQPGVGAEIRNHVCSIILESYTRKHGQWPPFISPPRDGTKLANLHRLAHPAPRLSLYEVSDWDGVVIGKIFTVDDRPDGLESMDDKSIAPPRHRAGTALSSRCTGAESSSLIEATMAEEEPPGADLLDDWEAGRGSDGVDAQWSHIRLASKGGEMKGGNKGREFAMLPRPVRSILGMAGTALRDNIFPLMEGASKRLSPKELSDRMRGLMASSEMFMEVDLESWNLKFSNDNTKETADALDAMCGRKIYGKIHDYLKHCIVVSSEIRMATTGPGAEHVPAGWWTYSGHETGFEGQAQEFWQICTEGMFRACLIKVDWPAVITLQGDNVTLAGPMPDNPLGALRDLEVEVSRFGHTMKPDECELYSGGGSYSKVFYTANGSRIPTSKFMSRALSIPEHEPRTASRTIESAGGVFLAAASEMPGAITAYQAYRRFQRVAMLPYLSLVCGIDCTPLVDLPNWLGGAADVTLGRAMWRGHADTLSTDVASVMVTRPEAARRFLSWYMSTTIIADTRRLVADPFSIPLRRPVTVKSSCKKRMGEWIRGSTSNRMLADVLSVSSERDMDEINAVMVSTVPCHPRIFADIYSRTTGGTAQRISDRLTGSTSVGVMVHKAGYDLIASRVLADRKLILYCSMILKDVGRCNPIGPMTAYAACEMLRSKWGIPGLQGVTLISPLDGLIGRSGPHGAIECRWSDIIKWAGKSYAGVKTKQMRVKSEYDVDLVDSAGRDIKALMLLRSQIRPIGSLADLISKAVYEKCGKTPAEIENMFETVAGGTAAHRSDALESVSFSHGVRASEYLRCRVSTDSLAMYGDYPMVVQEWMLYSVSLRQWKGDELVIVGLDLTDIKEINDDWTAAGSTTVAPPKRIRSDRRSLLIVNSLVAKERSGTVGSLPIPDGSFRRIGPAERIAAAFTDLLLRPPMFVSGFSDSVPFEYQLDRSMMRAVRSTDVLAGAGVAVACSAMAQLAYWGRGWDGVTFRSVGLAAANRIASVIHPHILGDATVAEEWADRGIVCDTGRGGVIRLVTSIGSAIFDVAEGYCSSSHDPVVFIPSAGSASASFYRMAGLASCVLIGSSRSEFRAKMVTLGSCVRELRETGDVLETSVTRTYHRGAWMASIPGTAREVLRPLRGRGAASVRSTINPHIPIDPVRLSPVFTSPASIDTYQDYEFNPREVIDRVGSLAECDPCPSYCSAMMLNVSPGSKVMVVGSGQGGIAAYLTAIGCTVIGVDLWDAFPSCSFKTFVPPVVASTGIARNFRWSTMTLASSAGWFETGSRDVALESPTVVILALEYPGPTRLAELDPLSGYSGILYWRVRDSGSDAAGLLMTTNSVDQVIGIRGDTTTWLTTESYVPVIQGRTMGCTRLVGNTERVPRTTQLLNNLRVRRLLIPHYWVTDGPLSEVIASMIRTIDRAATDKRTYIPYRQLFAARKAVWRIARALRGDDAIDSDDLIVHGLVSNTTIRSHLAAVVDVDASISAYEGLVSRK